MPPEANCTCNIVLKLFFFFSNPRLRVHVLAEVWATMDAPGAKVCAHMLSYEPAGCTIIGGRLTGPRRITRSVDTWLRRSDGGEAYQAAVLQPDFIFSQDKAAPAQLCAVLRHHDAATWLRGPGSVVAHASSPPPTIDNEQSSHKSRKWVD